MKYAIVNKRSAEASGISVNLHRQNTDKTKIILNENELRKMGDPATVAKKLGGELVSVKELNNLINSEVWLNK